MTDTALAAAIAELYQGEVFGEALFDRLLHHVEEGDQRYKIALMLQLETETKARLRPLAMRWGVDLAEDPAARAGGEALAETMAPLPWAEKMRMLFQKIDGEYLPRYAELAMLAAGHSEEVDVFRSMITHEAGLRECARREFTGEKRISAEPILALLRHRLPEAATLDHGRRNRLPG